MKPKKKNPTDLTLRNLRAEKKRYAALEGRIARLEDAVEAPCNGIHNAGVSAFNIIGNNRGEMSLAVILLLLTFLATLHAAEAQVCPPGFAVGARGLCAATISCAPHEQPSTICGEGVPLCCKAGKEALPPDFLGQGTTRQIKSVAQCRAALRRGEKVTAAKKRRKLPNNGEIR